MNRSARPLALILTCAGLLGAGGARAATLVVTSTADSGPGTLRAAIDGAAAGDEVVFALPLPATITTNSLLGINVPLTINGPGHELLTIRRNPDGPPGLVARNALGAVTTLRGLSIENGGYGSFDDLTVEACAFRNTEGPGLSLSVGSARIDASIFEDNRTGSSQGDGIFVSIADGKTLEVTRSTLRGNDGAGIRINASASSIVTIANSTVAENGGPGVDLSFGGALFVENSTLAGNVADLRLDQGGGPAAPRAFLRSSIFASAAPTFVVLNGATVASRGHNLSVSALPAGEGGLIDVTDLSSVDPRLGPLADHGGPTPTMAITSASPAADAGDCDESAPARTTDQRFHPRTSGRACDIGAFEADAATALVHTTVEPAGANCPAGGTRIDVGVDDGAGDGVAFDGVLQDGEVDETRFVCNGAAGADGDDGVDGSDGSDGSDGATGAPGQDGADGEGCTVIDNDDGTGTLTCPDGTSVEVELADGCNGAGGVPLLAVLTLVLRRRRAPRGRHA